VLIVIVQLAARDLSYYTNNEVFGLYNSESIVAAAKQVLDGTPLPNISQVGAPVDSTVPPRASSNNALIFGSSAFPCY
jgi:hypothetical protein